MSKGDEPQESRPSHNDFRTASELRAMEFTGIRRNSLGLSTEAWVLGEVVLAVTDVHEEMFPGAFLKAYNEYFMQGARR